MSLLEIRYSCSYNKRMKQSKSLNNAVTKQDLIELEERLEKGLEKAFETKPELS